MGDDNEDDPMPDDENNYYHSEDNCKQIINVLKLKANTIGANTADKLADSSPIN